MGAFLAGPTGGKAGSIVLTYDGEYMVWLQEEEEKMQEYPKTGYIWRVHLPDGKWLHIRASKAGNKSRFINHADKPNCAANVVTNNITLYIYV